MSKNKKVVRYRKPFNVNIGMIIFIIIFIYLIFNIFSYMTTEHISTYEVEQGTMAEYIPRTDSAPGAGLFLGYGGGAECICKGSFPGGLRKSDLLRR